MLQRGSRSRVKNIERNAVDPELPEGKGEFQSLLRRLPETDDPAATDGKAPVFQNFDGLHAIPEGMGRTYFVKVAFRRFYIMVVSRDSNFS